MRKILCACFIIGFAGYLGGYATCNTMWYEAFERHRQKREAEDPSYGVFRKWMEEEYHAES